MKWRTISMLLAAVLCLSLAGNLLQFQHGASLQVQLNELYHRMGWANDLDQVILGRLIWLRKDLYLLAVDVIRGDGTIQEKRAELRGLFQTGELVMSQGLHKLLPTYQNLDLSIMDRLYEADGQFAEVVDQLTLEELEALVPIFEELAQLLSNGTLDQTDSFYELQQDDKLSGAEYEALMEEIEGKLAQFPHK